MKYVAVLLLVLLVRAGIVANPNSLRPKNLAFGGGGAWGSASVSELPAGSI
ncbi:hypothetical protein [Spirosoma spitsbergense]|uniref:hypothetical protein n=1 Tax=Spirosoma spitsbergense TaxID=431554 RepID=UPI0003817C9B|nr:hypothetical protein [Spirosoma spitsbergense]